MNFNYIQKLTDYELFHFLICIKNKQLVEEVLSEIDVLRGKNNTKKEVKSETIQKENIVNTTIKKQTSLPKHVFVDTKEDYPDLEYDLDFESFTIKDFKKYYNSKGYEITPNLVIREDFLRDLEIKEPCKLYC